MKRILSDVLAGIAMAAIVTILVYGGVEAYAIERTGVCIICLW